MKNLKILPKPSLFYGTCDEYGICAGKASHGIKSIFLTDDKITALVAHVKAELAPYLIELVQRKAEKSAESELEIIRTCSQALRCLAKYRGVGLIRTMKIVKKSSELARSSELAPSGLAQHTCMF